MRHLILIPLILITIFSNAQNHDWTRTNPGGGGAFSTIGASKSGIIIAGSDLSGAYRSVDGGQSWDVIGLNKGMDETHVSGLGFNQNDGNLLYIGTENGIFRSEDGGDSVSKVLGNGYITDIEFGTNNLSTGYASFHPSYDSNNGVIYKSTNNGITWSQSSTNLPNGIRILKIVINPSDVNKVFLLTGQGRFACGPADVYKSIDGGITWSNITTNIKSVLDISISPTVPNDLYITTMNADCSQQYYWTDLEGNLYKSTDGGITWGNPLSDYTGIIWLDNNNASTIRLIDPREPYPWNDRAGTFTSTHGGLSFTQTGIVDNWDSFYNDNIFWSYGTSYNGICKTLGKDLSDNSNYYWTNSQWVFKSNDNGNIFNNIFTDESPSGFWRSRGFDNVNMMDIDISDINKNIIYAAYFDIGLWRSVDRGQSWQSCNIDTYTGSWDGYGGNCASVAADPSTSNMVWATMSDNQNGQAVTYLIRNNNTGDKNSWVSADTGLPAEEIMGISIDPNSATNNRTLYVTALGDVYKSTSAGNSWTKVLDCNGCRFTKVDPIDSDIVYAGGESGFWVTTDDGSNWTDQSHVDMKGDSVFWNSAYDGIFDISTDPNHANWVYVTAMGNNKGLYKSTNNGTTWTKLLTDNYMRKVAVSPTNSDLIYATSSSAFEAGGYDPSSNGIWYSDDGGQNWIKQNDSMVYPFALAIDIDNSSTPMVFVGSPGTGFQYSEVYDPTLPVLYLQSLTARVVEDVVLLSWKISEVENASHFELQHSADGIHWDLLYKININSSQEKYTYIDQNPISPISYYRLKQVDTNQHFTYSDVIMSYISNNSKTTLLSPNPTSSIVHIQSKRKINKIEMYDIFGQYIKTTYSGNNQLDLSNMVNGIYIIKLKSTYTTSIHKVILR